MERKLKIKYDKRVPNTAELEVDGESHTLANMVTERLLEDKRCTFSAYKMEHPLEERVVIRVSAIKSCPVISLVLDCLRALSRDIDDVISQLGNAEQKDTLFSKG
jgi:DNA-directed RNA polymerase II subunit RPB11